MREEISQVEALTERIENEDMEKEKSPESAEILVQQLGDKLDNLLLEIEDSATKLLSSSDISTAERDSFVEEVNNLKGEVISVKKDLLEKFANLDPDFMEMAEGIKAELDEFDADAMFSELMADKKEKLDGIAGISFILDNVDFQHVDALKEELEKQKNGYGGITKPKFPLDENSLNVLEAMTQEEPTSLSDLKRLIKITETAVVLVERGISLETLQRIEKNDSAYSGSFFEIANNEDLVQKLILLDQMDSKFTDRKFELRDLEKLPLDQMKLLAQNPHVAFSWEDSSVYQLESLATCLTEENLVKLKQFDSEISSISINEFISFVNNILDLPEGVQKICKEEYDKGEKMGVIVFNNRDLLKGLDDDKIGKLKNLLQEGVISSLHDSGLDEYLKLDEHIFNRCDSLGEDIKKAPVSRLLKLNEMSNEEFHLFEKITKANVRYSGHDLEVFDEINSRLGVEDGSLFMEWAAKCDSAGDLKYFADFGYFIQEIILEKFKDLAEIIKSEPDIDLLNLVSKAYGPGKLKGALRDYAVDEEGNVLSETATRLKESPEEIIPDILSNSEAIENTFIHFSEVQKMFNQKNIHFTEKDLSLLFEKTLERNPLVILNSKEFPFTPEQAQYVEIFKKIEGSSSRELKNLATEIIPLIAKDNTQEEASKALEKIEQIFLTNNIPLVGKQYKVFEILYSNEKLTTSVSRGKVDSLKELRNSSAQRLEIFKDLMRAHIASADSNLEQYLLVLKEGKEMLAAFEAEEELSDEKKESLKFFLKKINTLSGHSGRKSINLSMNSSDEEMRREIDELGKSFGAREGESLIQKFERTFLKRIGIESLEDALEAMKGYREETTLRNEKGAESGSVQLEEGDLVKSISSDYLDSYLDRGVYAPEFIGAESHNSKTLSKFSDATPLDTDLSLVNEKKKMSEMFDSGYGDIMLVVKQKEQFQKDGLDVFKTGVIADNHYGIRTGFGSTEIDAIYVGRFEDSEKKLDQLKFFIAKKGFYIPLCDSSDNVIFTKEEYDEQRKIFSGIERFHGGNIEISDEWKSSQNAREIEDIAQTKENMEKVTSARNMVMDKIQGVLAEEGIVLHKGKYDDSLRGAVIADTGSTGRGSALDEKFDFDFAVKIDDNDWEKVSVLMRKLGDIFPEAEQYENRGMMMFRSKEIEINGLEMTVDIGFNSKSDSEEFDAHNALEEKYASIVENVGEQAHLDTLTNIRFAKKKLKEAGCYKKGGGGNGQQGGLGGIGVEYWILQNDGDATKAFESFKQQAFEDGQLVPFGEFKKSHKVFSAGQNIRGAVKVENFMDNMTAQGYTKMAQLAEEITG